MRKSLKSVDNIRLTVIQFIKINKRGTDMKNMKTESLGTVHTQIV